MTMVPAVSPMFGVGDTALVCVGQSDCGFKGVVTDIDLLDLCLLIPSGTKGRNNTPPANSILAGPP